MTDELTEDVGYAPLQWQIARNTARRNTQIMPKRRYAVVGYRIAGEWIYYAVPVDSKTWRNRHVERRMLPGHRAGLAPRTVKR